MDGPLSKLCVTPPFSINFRCQIENQVSDYRLLGASSLTIILFWHVHLFDIYMYNMECQNSVICNPIAILCINCLVCCLKKSLFKLNSIYSIFVTWNVLSPFSNIQNMNISRSNNYITSVFHWNVTIWYWLWSGHMIIKEMFYIPIKLKPEPARTSMTTSDVNNQWHTAVVISNSKSNRNKIHNEKFNCIKFWCDLNVIIRIECIFL